MYLAGPFASPHLYSSSDRAKLRVGTTDSSRRQATSRTCRATRTGNAIMGDPRNDENIILAGLHAAFLKFHNNMVDMVRSDAEGPRYA